MKKDGSDGRTYSSPFSRGTERESQHREHRSPITRVRADDADQRGGGGGGGGGGKTNTSVEGRRTRNRAQPQLRKTDVMKPCRRGEEGEEGRKETKSAARGNLFAGIKLGTSGIKTYDDKTRDTDHIGGMSNALKQRSWKIHSP